MFLLAKFLLKNIFFRFFIIKFLYHFNSNIRMRIERVGKKIAIWNFHDKVKFDFKKLNLLFNKSCDILFLIDSDICEYYWICKFFSQFNLLNHINNIDYSTNDRIILIYNDNKNIQFIKKFKKLHPSKKIILFHISDESCNHDISVYRYADYIYRNHYSISLFNKNVSIFPLGPNGDVFFNIKKPITKKYIFNFIGDINKPSRSFLLDQINDLNFIYLHTYSGWLSNNMLPKNEYKKVLEDSAFTIAPSGFYSAETFRFWEALLSKSIPIIFENNEYLFLIRYWGIENSVLYLDDMDKIKNIDFSCYFNTSEFNEFLLKLGLNFNETDKL